MNTSSQKNIALIVSATFLFLALLDGWSYDFFTVLRIVVCASSAYVSWTAFQIGMSGYGWTYTFIAILFNPFALITFERETWVVIDALIAVFNISSIWLIQTQDEVN